MVQHRRETDWDHTAMLVHTIAQFAGDKKSTPLRHNPYRRVENQKSMRSAFRRMVDEESK